MQARWMTRLGAVAALLALVACTGGGPDCRGLTNESLLRDMDARIADSQRIWDDGWRDICARHGQPPPVGSRALAAWNASTRLEVDELRARWQASVKADGDWLRRQDRPPQCPQGRGTSAKWGLHSSIGDGEPEYYCDSCKADLASKHGDGDGLLSWRRL